MLKQLHIEQFVIIDRLDLDFKSNLTVLTGETGAGKSILLDAMGLILGEPADFESIRSGSDKSILRAVFAPPSGHPAWAFLHEKGAIEKASSEFTIQRTLKTTQMDEILIDGKPVELDVLKQLGTLMVEIHGQFANQSLLDPSNQLTLLDLSGGFEPEVFKNVADALHDVRRYKKEIEEEDLFLTRNKKDMPRVESVMARFDKIGMREGFIADVEAEYARLLTAKQSSQAFQDILAQFIAANGIVMALTSAVNTLDRYQALDRDKTAKLSEHINIALENSRAAVTEMRKLAPQYDIDLGPIEKLRHILDVLMELAKEAKIPFEQLPQYHADMSAKLERLRNGRERMAELDKLLARAKSAYIHHAQILSQKRKEAGKALSERITAELAPLKLQRAEFQVHVEERPNMEWTERGINHVTFTARMNPGMPFSPVAETASGGELARLILALKVVVQEVQTIPTLVFDEVDTGIGGAAAAAVGERLAQLADATQVLVITHSPQVASRGAQHLHVAKSSDGITTTSNVRTLSLDERTDEISRMLAGDIITPESRAAATSLINEASKAAEVRRAAN